MLALSCGPEHLRHHRPVLPRTSIGLSRYRQITPPTKNGHAPPSKRSRKSSQSVNPYFVWTW
ncbi:hypothetical protein BO70DRAFT_304704 [Aspergillus heteromorphus CBS 117.55]|uniref:Uncharacterized protein n=1 Tax=Aspergillus heteromorphus CBS 117.55 TaxID=1448321 RepID=A0A317UME2_9EURO|nr:hypothetical protein BO70DRAFT_304704 [Aspergillus heteromorphus CBS 117.55]